MMKSLAPLPIKAVRRYLGKRALVVCTDEYRTFKVCYGCDNPLLDINDQNMLRCGHQTKMTISSQYVNRDNQPRHRKRRWCLVDGEPDHWTSYRAS
ncbi:hypothetical protein BJV82DRAFT_633014 [Fennellomyces sp. T-0311]|nr:hypothetical protein BJV82DRAFT_633014 [Fennellomyces sp. T-0311]